MGQTKSASTKVNFTNILHAAFCQFLFAKKLQIQTVSLEIMQVTLSERRVLSRMREAQKRQARMLFGLEKREHGKSEEKPR